MVELADESEIAMRGCHQKVWPQMTQPGPQVTKGRRDTKNAAPKASECKVRREQALEESILGL